MNIIIIPSLEPNFTLDGLNRLKQKWGKKKRGDKLQIIHSV